MDSRQGRDVPWMASIDCDGDQWRPVQEMLHLAVQERLAECSRCLHATPYLVQLSVICHQVALCGPCIRDLQRLVWVDRLPQFYPPKPSKEL